MWKTVNAVAAANRELSLSLTSSRLALARFCVFQRCNLKCIILAYLWRKETGEETVRWKIKPWHWYRNNIRWINSVINQCLFNIIDLVMKTSRIKSQIFREIFVKIYLTTVWKYNLWRLRISPVFTLHGDLRTKARKSRKSFPRKFSDHFFLLKKSKQINKTIKWSKISLYELAIIDSHEYY